jgi:hypothetical protein
MSVPDRDQEVAVAVNEKDSTRLLWRELGRIRKDQKITYGQLHIKIGGDAKMSKKTLQDRLTTGRKTCWEDLRLVGVIGLGQDERELKERFDRAQLQHRSGSTERENAFPPRNKPIVSTPRKLRPRIAAVLTGALTAIALPVAIGLWTETSGTMTAPQEPECVRVSNGEVRVYNVPGEEKGSFLKYKDERIRFLVPYEEAVDSQGHIYRRVLTPSRNDGYGWILDNAVNVTTSC